MTFVALGWLAACLMGACCWASNVWPGDETLWRGALGRLFWWGAPMAYVVWINGAPPLNAIDLGMAAWIGAWVPHTEFPDLRAHWSGVLIEAAIVLVRVAAMLAPPAAVFWLCGAYWPAVLLAAVMALPCMYLALVLPHGWWGLRDTRQVSGVLFGVTTGWWLAVAVWAPERAPDFLP